MDPGLSTSGTVRDCGLGEQVPSREVESTTDMVALQWCRQRLPEVSRTFALGIQALPEPLEAWVTVAYHLCRVVDTVEDDPVLSGDTRQVMFTSFRLALETGEAEAFVEAAALLEPGPDARVCRGLGRLLAAFSSFPPEVVRSVRRWVGEMAEGMALYAQGRTDDGRCVPPRDRADLDRYCHYVAGTVGHLLTDLFCLDDPSLEARRAELERCAGAFGLLLQLTNIVKDVAKDWERGFCFLPGDALEREGVPVDALLAPEHRPSALRVVDAVVGVARDQAPVALDYLRALGTDSPGPLRFCMLLALRSLDLVAGNPAVLEPELRVKLSRAVVAETLEELEMLLAEGRVPSHMLPAT